MRFLRVIPCIVAHASSASYSIEDVPDVEEGRILGLKPLSRDRVENIRRNMLIATMILHASVIDYTLSGDN
jgi:hypothetical protein